ncbi:MAG: hypothetical protein RL732_546 [Bacteroidota bacterium]|jgi:hypothetical protein
MLCKKQYGHLIGFTVEKRTGQWQLETLRSSLKESFLNTSGEKNLSLGPIPYLGHRSEAMN